MEKVLPAATFTLAALAATLKSGVGGGAVDSMAMTRPPSRMYSLDGCAKQLNAKRAKRSAPPPGDYNDLVGKSFGV